MAFTLQIKQKRIFGKTVLDIPSLARACGLCYGSVDGFHILQAEKLEGGTAICYDPARIGRGIFLDASKAGEGRYEVQYNIPTTRAEIGAFTRLAQEIERRLGRAEMYCVEEERTFTGKDLEQGIETFAQFSLRSLNQFCGDKTYSHYILPLALWPYTLPEEKVAAWRDCADLSDFEETLHRLQSMDIYYAKPQLRVKSATKEIGAFYALTEDCRSVFPVRADGFLNLDEIKVAEGFIQLVLYQEKRVLEGLIPYERFIQETERRGVQRFDEDHILVPPMGKEELEGLAERLR